MNIAKLLGALFGGLIGSSAVFLLILNALRERWIAAAKASYDKDLEGFKDRLEANQKSLQARLDQGSYVSKAQFDVELAAYKSVWEALTGLQKSADVLGGFGKWDRLGIAKATTITETEEAVQRFMDRRNELAGLDHALSPFYDQGVHDAVRGALEPTRTVMIAMIKWQMQRTEERWQAVADGVPAILRAIDAIEPLIRARLQNMRIASPEPRTLQNTCSVSPPSAILTGRCCC